MKILAAFALAILGSTARASAEGRVDEPRLALAALSAPGLDMAHLNHFFDVARLQFQTLTAPKAAAQSAPKPIMAPVLSKINTEKHSLVVPPPVASAAYL